MPWDSEARQAITNKQVLDFTYHGRHRVAEPHVYGIKDGKYQLLTYQIRGESSSGGLPNWRRVDLDAVSNLTILDERFPGRRPTPTGQHQAFDTILLIVDD
jgi:hypothetical protein